jgi:GNAT superfamily N-acetyltransferase
MKVDVTSDPVLFRRWTFPFLQRDPVLNTVLLTTVESRAAGLVVDSEPAIFVCVRERSGEVTGAAMRTPGRAAFIGALDDELVPYVADAFAEHDPVVSGVFGIESAAQLFVDRWPVPATVLRGSRLHRLGALVPQTATGMPRLADDVGLCARWSVAFHDEVGEPGGDESVAWATDRIAAGALWLWEDDGKPVSLVGHQLPTFGVTRIGPVYTPPEHRGHGYASALTAHVSRLIRDRGDEACLHTDLANPTSNKIYAAIGYRPVADFVQYAFSGDRDS